MEQVAAELREKDDADFEWVAEEDFRRRGYAMTFRKLEVERGETEHALEGGEEGDPQAGEDDEGVADPEEDGDLS